jgi:hypothetical protein
MRPIRYEQFRRLTLGSSCALGLAMSGCAKPPNSLTKDDLKAKSAAEERAAGSMDRSRKELLAQERDRKAGKLPSRDDLLADIQRNSQLKQASATIDEDEEAKPPESKFSAFKGKLASLRPGKPKPKADPLANEDPFLADSIAKGERKSKSKELAKETESKFAKTTDSKDPIARTSAETSKTPTEKKSLASADSRKAERDEALEAFLRDQKPVSARKRPTRAITEDAEAEKSEIAAANPKLDEHILAAKPKAAVTKLKASDTADADAASPLERALLAKGEAKNKLRANASASQDSDRPAKARPFPAEDDDILQTSGEQAATTSIAKKPAKKPVADAAIAATDKSDPPTGNHPLATGKKSGAAKPPAKPSVGPQIQELLVQAQESSETGDYANALNLAAQASKLATTSRHAFAEGEEQPGDVIALISEKLAAEQSQAVAQNETVESPSDHVEAGKFATASWANNRNHPGKHNVYEEPESPAEEEPFIDGPITPYKAAAKAGGPNWPAVTSKSFAASDHLWESESSDGFSTAMETPGRSAEQQFIASTADTHQAADLTRLVAANATDAEASDVEPALATSTDVPVVELGPPTSTLPPAMASLSDAAEYHPASTTDRLAPPPLDESVLAVSPVGSKTAKSPRDWRVLWPIFGCVALAVSVLVYRRKSEQT